MSRYLKSISLQGFKSFPVKTNVEFVDGVTGIVGANGSGKSNVIEAIKWVLGEQSAKSLRGDKMEDVIFNGTKDRSASSMCEVNLTFNNDNHWLPIEFEEVSVARRMFRSGESQYNINKSRVRLKEVVELFLDTGVGRDSYAIFEQGKIDRLLSESPTERRTLFEDFAGISKFKFRKEEAERKLENSRANIDRVNDIILELEKEVVNLKEQAENAAKHNEIRVSLNNLEMKSEALIYRNFEKEINNKQNQKKNMEDKLLPLQEDAKKREEDILQADNNVIAKETEFNSMRDDYAKVEREFGEIRSRLENNKDRKHSLQNQLKSMETRLTEGEEREKVLKRELEETQQEMEKFAGQKDTAGRQLQNIQDKIDTIHNEIRELDGQILARSKEIGFDAIITKDHIEKQRQDLVGLQTKLEDYRVTLEEKWNLSRGLQAEIGEKSNLLEMSSRDIANLKGELSKILEDIDRLIGEEDGIKQSNTQYNEEVRSLQQKLKSMDQVIMGSLEKQSHLLKDFTDQKPGLDSKIEGVINELTECIQIGRPFEETKNVIIRLKENFNEYKAYYESILGILYSDEGTYTQKEHTQKNIEDIAAGIAQNEHKLEETRGKLKELHTVRENIQNNYIKNDYELTSLQNEIKKMNDRLSNDLEGLKNLENQINSISDSINKKQSSIEGMQKIVEDYDREIGRLKSARGELLDDLNKKKIDFAGVEEKHRSLSREASRIKNQIADIERNKANYENDRQSVNQNIENMEKRIEEDTNNFEVFSRKVEKFQEEIEARKSEIEGIHQARKSLEAQRKEVEANILKIERSIMNIETAISERKGHQDSIVENVKKLYSVEVSLIHLEEDDKYDHIAAKINELREELKKLGDVNQLAIEQFQNAKERLEFLQTQKADSEKAMQDIIALIDETNKKCVEQFVAAFEDIRKAFKKIFARLFDGGKADLVLENKDDVLNSGINIFAEPPGKKFASISLLSGGERALVAIAVIFAILYLKPTPFVVLDEMDAPLDDDNIERFKALLADFKQTSQFVIVSHSKSTLEICDSLYGVTMEEQGVSKVISVAFDEAQLLFKTEDNVKTEA